MCRADNHAFEKFDDHRIFCQKCGLSLAIYYTGKQLAPPPDEQSGSAHRDEHKDENIELEETPDDMEAEIARRILDERRPGETLEEAVNRVMSDYTTDIQKSDRITSARRYIEEHTAQTDEAETVPVDEETDELGASV